MCPPELVEHHQHGVGGYRRKRIDQFIEPEFLDVGGSNLTVTVAEFGELQLRDPDRILVGHAVAHQARDLTKRCGIDALTADEALQPLDIELCIGGALIIHQQMNAIADDGRGAVGQAVGKGRRRVILLVEEIGEQIAKRRQQAVV